MGQGYAKYAEEWQADHDRQIAELYADKQKRITDFQEQMRQVGEERDRQIAELQADRDRRLADFHEYLRTGG
jgi:hypothetical protein